MYIRRIASATKGSDSAYPVHSLYEDLTLIDCASTCTHVPGCQTISYMPRQARICVVFAPTPSPMINLDINLSEYDYYFLKISS